MPVYNQQEYRWATVSGRRPPLLSPREKRIAEALLFSGELDTDGVINAMRDFLNRFFRYTPGETEEKRPRPTAFWRLLLRHETKRRDRLLVRIGTGEGNHPKAKQQRHEGLGRHVGPTEEDAAYIRAVFGRSILSEQERTQLERFIEEANREFYKQLTSGAVNDYNYNTCNDFSQRKNHNQQCSI